MLVVIFIKYRINPYTTVFALEQTRQIVPYFSNFIAKSWLNDLEDIGLGERLLHATHPLMLVIICTKYRKNPSWTACAVKRTQYLTYFSSFIAKSWLIYLEDICQRSLCVTHLLILLIVCAEYGKNPCYMLGVTEWTLNAGRTDGWSETNPPKKFCVSKLWWWWRRDNSI